MGVGALTYNTYDKDEFETRLMNRLHCNLALAEAITGVDLKYRIAIKQIPFEHWNRIFKSKCALSRFILKYRLGRTCLYDSSEIAGILAIELAGLISSEDIRGFIQVEDQYWTEINAF